MFLIQRLHEFGATPSGKLTIDEFFRIDLESEFAPPSFIKSQADLEYTITDGDIDIAEHAVQAQKLVPEIENKVAKEEDRINKGLEKKMKKRLKKRKSSSEEEEDEEMKAARSAGFLDAENPADRESRRVVQQINSKNDGHVISGLIINFKGFYIFYNLYNII